MGHSLHMPGILRLNVTKNCVNYDKCTIEEEEKCLKYVNYLVILPLVTLNSVNLAKIYLS